MSTIPERLETATAAIEADATTLHTQVGSLEDAVTAAEAAQTAAEAAQTAATAAATAAAASQTAAATSATNAAASAAAAETARAAAVVAKDAAVTAKTAAETAQTAAAGSATAAAASASAASASQSAAAASASAASASQSAAATSATGAATSATTATTQATNAATSAAAAATSATSAANTIANGFLGGIAGVSVPSTAALAGNYYRIITAGTSQSKTWAVGDLAIYNGTSGSWTQVSGNITDPAHLAFKTNPLAPRGGIVNNATANAYVRSTLTSQAIAAGPFSLVFGFEVSAKDPTPLAWLGPTATGHDGSPGDSVLINQASGRLRWEHLDTSFALTTVDLTANTFTATNLGKRVICCVARDVLGNITCYINGVAQLTGTSTKNINSLYFGLGRNASSSVSAFASFQFGSLYNLALSAVDALEIYELSGAVPARFQFGSQASVYTSNFSAGVDSWASDALRTVSGNVDTDADGAGFPPSNDWLKVIMAGATTMYVYRTAMGLAKAAVFRVRATVVKNGTIGGTHAFILSEVGVTAGVQTVADGRQILVAWSGSQASFDGVIKVLNVANGLAPMVGVCASTGIGGNEPIGAAIYLKDVIFQQVGAVVHLPLDDGYGLQLQDVSSNKLHAIMTTVGISHAVPTYGPARVRGSTSTNGNQQLGAATILKGPSQVLRIRARSLSGTPTVTIGTSSGGAQLVASVALSTTWKNLTIALTDGYVSADASVWVGSNSTDIVEIDISFEPLSS